MIDVSIVICTKDRACYLHDTLRSIAAIHMPQDYTAELVVVDNGSKDHTQDVVRAFQSDGLASIRLIEEPKCGLNNARNTAVSSSNGKVILFTDDDVRVPENWVSGMTQPILSDTADAVAGGVTLAPHLQRPWQEKNPDLMSPLAATRAISSDHPARMVGANMAVARHAFEMLPPFDPNLDAGTPLGLGGDTLFSFQLRDAGFRMISAFDVAVEHHCDPDRISRESYLAYAEKVGRSEAYIDYHWRQQSAVPVLRTCAELVRKYGALVKRRLTRYRDLAEKEGVPLWEYRLLMEVYYRLQLLAEQITSRGLKGTRVKDRSNV